MARYSPCCFSWLCLETTEWNQSIWKYCSGYPIPFGIENHQKPLTSHAKSKYFTISRTSDKYRRYLLKKMDTWNITTREKCTRDSFQDLKSQQHACYWSNIFTLLAFPLYYYTALFAKSAGFNPATRKPYYEQSTHHLCKTMWTSLD